MVLPLAHRWLLKEPGPKILVAALKDYGVREVPGTKSNPVILQWAAELGLDATYKQDAMPWCGLALGHWCKAAGYSVPENPLWARNWSRWGLRSDTPMLGDVLVFVRENNAGHTGLYIAESDDSFQVLGGNQGDKVGIDWIAKDRLISARRCPWRIAQPPNVRVIKQARLGYLTIKES